MYGMTGYQCFLVIDGRGGDQAATIATDELPEQLDRHLRGAISTLNSWWWGGRPPSPYIMSSTLIFSSATLIRNRWMPGVAPGAGQAAGLGQPRRLLRGGVQLGTAAEKLLAGLTRQRSSLFCPTCLMSEARTEKPRSPPRSTIRRKTMRRRNASQRWAWRWMEDTYPPSISTPIDARRSFSSLFFSGLCSAVVIAALWRWMEDTLVDTSR